MFSVTAQNAHLPLINIGHDSIHLLTGKRLSQWKQIDPYISKMVCPLLHKMA
jgi:hypothetical protein